MAVYHCAVRAGIDTLDCFLVWRSGRNGEACLHRLLDWRDWMVEL